MSMEGIFKLVRECIKDRVEIKEFFCDPSLSRFQNTLQGKKAAGEINHITGDVNFLAIGFGGKKNIITIHDFGFYENPVHSKLVKLVYHIFWYYLPLKRVDIVTVVSEFTKEKLIRYFKFPEARIRVIHDPVKPLFTYVKKERLGDKLVVLMMGTGKHKNLDNLIEAAKGSDFHLDIIGWPAADEVDKLSKYGISYTVYNSLTDEQVYERYIACDVLFMASLYEGFGMPLIEAQAVGRPVVTSNIGAMKEIGEGSAILVDPHKPQEISDAVLSLRNRQTYDEVVRKGIANSAKYEAKKIAEQYLAVYKEVGKKISK
jgi:glycosyltransferase involved in cell wall biosynthesis